MNANKLKQTLKRDSERYRQGGGNFHIYQKAII